MNTDLVFALTFPTLFDPRHGGHQEDITVFPDVFHCIDRYYFF